MSNAAQSLLDPAALQRDVDQQLGIGLVSLTYHQSCASTNSECMQQGRHGAVVIAERQTAGRGRRGNHWHSSSADNIYCSLGIDKTIPGEYLGLVSLQVGISIAEVLHEFGYPEVNLKWPNDVLLLGRKLGGILTETRAKSPDQFFLVIGLGLNTTQDSSTLRAIDRPAISLAEVSNGPIDRQCLLARLVPSILNAVDELEPANADALVERFISFDGLHGQAVRVQTRQQAIAGVYHGLEKTGQIKIATENGLQSFAAADISLRER